MLNQPFHSTEEGKKRLRILVIIDGVMILLLLGNLAWMVFDWFFAFPPFHDFFQANFPHFYRFYEPVHLKYWSYDLVFAAIYLFEFFLRWYLSVLWKEYHRWFFYPAIHVYDFIGCIPGPFRWLRLFRVVAFSARLNKLVRIDNIVFRKFHKYRDVFMEEISDRVVVNVLNDMQTELQTGTPLFKRVIQEVIRPKRQVLTELLVDKLRTVARDMNDIFDQEMRLYIEGCIRKALTSSEDIRLLEKIPGAGKMISRRVEIMASDIAFHTVDKIFRDIHAPENDRVLHELAGKIIDGILAEAKGDLNSEMVDIINKTIDVIKEQVAEKQWKIKEMQEKAVCREK
ncbi:MAG: hypothetical protein M0Q01_08820 [Syntrophales bacterium]|jgi:hypothetical protein|nr:hypothetical protein [Syntrophales bacterium]